MRFNVALLIGVMIGMNVGVGLADEAGKPLKVCILSGCETYHSEKSLSPFQEFLEQNYNVRGNDRDVPKLFRDSHATLHSLIARP